MTTASELLNKITTQLPHLKWMEQGAIFITLHGSRAFGTHTESSDSDYKGVCVPPIKYYFGLLHQFEQAELKDPDAVLYELRKFFRLASDCNPSIIETLYTDPSDHLLVSSLGEILIDNRDMFLSKRAKHSFSGYAIGQLRKIQLHRRYFIDPPKAPPTRKDFGLPERTLIPQDQLLAASAEVQKELDRFQFNFMEELSEPMKIHIRNTMAEMLAELKITTEMHWEAAARKVGLSDNFIELMQKERQYTGKKREWDQYQHWKKERNPKRAADEEKYGFDCKNAYHLVRLMRMGREILTTGKVIVKRVDRDELIAIRNGAWTYEQVVEFAEREDKELQELYVSTNIIPKTPDFQALDELCIRMVEMSLNGGDR